MLDGVRFADVDVDSLEPDEMDAWREAIRALQIEYRDEFLSSLDDDYPRIPSGPLISHQLSGTMDIYYMVKGEGDSWHHVFVPRAGNEEIYSLRDAAKKLIESPAGQREMASLKETLCERTAEIYPDVPYRLEISEDGSTYNLWADLGQGEMVIGSAAYPLEQ